MAVQGVTKQFERRQRVKGSHRQYTFVGQYKDSELKKHVGDYMSYIHDDCCEGIMEHWREFQGKGMNMHDADVAHYNKRLALYDTLKEKLKRLDPLKEYAEIAAASYKMKAIREEFYNLKKRIKQEE